MSEVNPAIPTHCAIASSLGDKQFGPGATAFVLYNDVSLEVRRGATLEAFEAALATGFFDKVERIDVLKGATLEGFPEAIGRLTNANWLRISTVAFVGWEGLYQLTSLRSLVIDGAARGALPTGICALERLELLDARASGFEALPSDLAALARLAHVHVRPAMRDELARLTVASRSASLLMANHGLAFDGKVLRADKGASGEALEHLVDSGHVDGAVELVVEPHSGVRGLPAPAWVSGGMST